MDEKTTNSGTVLGVYLAFVRPHFFKIGVSSGDPLIRISTLQTGCPLAVELKAWVITDRAFIIERQLHSSLQEYRVRGEWFALPPEAIPRFFEESRRAEDGELQSLQRLIGKPREWWESKLQYEGTGFAVRLQINGERERYLTHCHEREEAVTRCMEMVSGMRTEAVRYRFDAMPP
jgi:hypothetical protein